MYVVGLTGGIGSGKSAASDYFKKLDITVVDADHAARVVVEPGSPALKKIQQHFGGPIIQADGTLDRAALRQHIFSNNTERQWLEALLHPLIREQMEQEVAQTKSPYVILSAPLLLEGDLYQRCDRILVVDVPEALQISRIIGRDNSTKDQIKKIITSQISREDRLQKADDIIDNSSSLETLQQKVKTLHHTYLDLARKYAQQKATDR